MNEKYLRNRIMSLFRCLMHCSFLSLLVLTIFITAFAYGQDKSTITKEKQTELIKEICEKLEKIYPVPES